MRRRVGVARDVRRRRSGSTTARGGSRSCSRRGDRARGAPGLGDLDIGLVGLHPPARTAREVRAFFPKDGALREDPVTGSLNASLALWLIGSGRLEAPYVARQGTVLGRAGRVHVDRDADGTTWIGGGTVTCMSGTVTV